MLDLKVASEKDLHIISNLAKVIWTAHYVSIVGQPQVDYMLEKMYSHESLVGQLVQKKHIFYLIEKNGEPIGFMAISSENKQDYFLHKFYIDQQKSNAGIGTEILNLLIEKNNPKTLTLTVNRQNYKSINFYFKNHFKIDQVADFDIGNGYQMNDFVMVRAF